MQQNLSGIYDQKVVRSPVAHCHKSRRKKARMSPGLGVGVKNNESSFINKETGGLCVLGTSYWLILISTLDKGRVFPILKMMRI